MEVKFTIPGPPIGKQRPRVVRNNGFARTYTPEKTVSYENLVKYIYHERCGSKFNDDSELQIFIKAYFDIPKSVSKKKRQMMIDGDIRPTKKPDADNIGKIVADSLNGVAYHDDSSIVGMSIEKWYSEEPRVEVKIWEVDNDTTGS